MDSNPGNVTSNIHSYGTASRNISFNQIDAEFGISSTCEANTDAKGRYFGVIARSTGLFFSLMGFTLFFTLTTRMFSTNSGVQNSAWIPDMLHQELYAIDACLSTPRTSRTTCCSVTNYPVLGGVDVVAFQQLPLGATPVLGKIDYAAGLSTTSGTYYFFFANPENRNLFLSDPWAYAPHYGGFDGWAMAESKILKGPSAKSQLGPNTDLSQWMLADGKLIMFAGEDEFSYFQKSQTHFTTEAERKWKGWFSENEAGVFNTRCFSGLTMEELTEASEVYEREGIPDKNSMISDAKGGGGDGLAAQLRSATTTEISNQDRRQGLAEATVYYVNAGKTRIERAAVETGTGIGFRRDILLEGFNSPKDIALDEANNVMYYTDMVHAEIRRCSMDGAQSYLDTELLVSGTVKPALLRLDLENHMMYWTDQVCEGCDEETKLIMRASMDGGDPEVVVQLPGHARGIDIGSDGYVYYTDFYEGTLSRIQLGEEILPREVVLDNLKEAAYMDYSDVEGSRVYWSEATGTQIAYVDLEEPTWTKRILIDSLSGYTDMVMVDPTGIYWTDKVGYVFRAPSLRNLLDAETTPAFEQDKEPFETVLDGLFKPKGMWVVSWPKSDGLDIVAATKYTERGDPPIYNDYHWAIGPIVEPYVTTTVVPNEILDGRVYEWILRGSTYVRNSLQVLGHRPQELALILREKNALTGEITREFRGGVTCKYVRREIKSLFDEDREAFFQAMETLIDVPMEEGKEIYGQNYRDMEYFISLHHSGAGARDCDHMHHGMGFLFQHVGLTLEFEQGLQVVNPAVTVPYWDFTVEGTEMYFRRDGDWSVIRNSVLFSPEWYGTADPETHTVTEGRWAYKLKVPGNQWGTSVPHNSYGLMRSPWNNNNYPYAQRYTTICGIPVTENSKWPQCQDHYEIMTTKYSWFRYSYAVGGAPHGPVHGFLGGTFYSEAAYDSLEEFMTPEDVYFLRTHTFNSPKNLWRKGLSECPEHCDMDTPMEECKCTCGEGLYEKLEDTEVLEEYYYTATAGGSKQIKGSYTDEQKKQIVHTICEAGTAIGDQLESASPADLIFWILHPTVDRLHQWRVKHVEFTEEEWPTEDNYRGSVYKDLPQQCNGHGPDDTLLWKMNMDDGDSYPKQYTNTEMYSITNPIGDYKMPYVYDNFKWPHCSEEGYDLENI